MAKKKLKKHSSLRQLYLHHKILGTVLIVLGAWILVWTAQVGLERYSFYKVEKAMDKINADIQSKFWVKSSYKNRGCGMRDEAFGEHLGGCSITYSYQIKAQGNAKETAQQIDRLVQNSTSVKISESDSMTKKSQPFQLGYKLTENEPDKYYSSYNFNGVKNPVCETEYTLPKEKYASLIKMYLSCYLSGRDARLPYFPVNN